MDTTQHLALLGEETINAEMLYLSLKVEKALAGENFMREQLLSEAESLWKEIDNEYHTFLSFLQTSSGAAA